MRINRIAVVSFACVLALGLVAAAPAAAENLLTNGSFEDPPYEPEEWIQGVPIGWESAPDWDTMWVGDPGPAEAPLEPYHGENCVWTGTADPYISLGQLVTLPQPIAAGDVYSFSMQVNTQYPNGTGAEITLYIGDPAWGLDYPYTTFTLPEDDQWQGIEQLLTVDDYDPGGGDPNPWVGMEQLYVWSDLSAGSDVQYDDAQLTVTPIPEPSSFVLAVLGLLGVAAFVARRRA